MTTQAVANSLAAPTNRLSQHYFTDNVVGGISIEFAGDNDVLTVGGRFYYDR